MGILAQSKPASGLPIESLVDIVVRAVPIQLSSERSMTIAVCCHHDSCGDGRLGRPAKRSEPPRCWNDSTFGESGSHLIPVLPPTAPTPATSTGNPRQQTLSPAAIQVAFQHPAACSTDPPLSTVNPIRRRNSSCSRSVGDATCSRLQNTPPAWSKPKISAYSARLRSCVR